MKKGITEGQIFKTAKTVADIIKKQTDSRREARAILLAVRAVLAARRQSLLDS